MHNWYAHALDKDQLWKGDLAIIIEFLPTQPQHQFPAEPAVQTESDEINDQLNEGDSWAFCVYFTPVAWDH